MGVTMADVARLAGVSKTTVSRVLNDRPDVDEETKVRVRKIVVDAGYRPSARAVSLATGQARTIGVLVPSLSWPWMSDVLQGIADVLEVAGYGLLLYTTTRGDESLAWFAQQVSSKSFDGLLVIEPPDTLDYIAGLYAAGLPVVLIDDRGQHPEFPSVATTNVDGGAMAARHLLLSRRQNLAMITGPTAYPCTTDRSAGFLGLLRERGLQPDDVQVAVGDFTEAGGHRAARKLLRSKAALDGLFVHNDLMAMGALRAIRENGRTVPGDIAVIGFDDIPMAAHVELPLTTVRQPSREMAATAAHMLLDHLAGTPAPIEPVVLPTSLVVRQSAPAPPGIRAPKPRRPIIDIASS